MLIFLIILHTIMSNKMYTKNKISLDINLNVGEAKQLFLKGNLTALPVVRNDIYQGLLFKNIIEDFKESKPLSLITHLFKDISLEKDYTFFDWFKLCSANDITQVPLVSSKKRKFKTNITLEDILEDYKYSGLTMELSTVLVIKKESQTFSYSEVFQIIETQGAKVLATFIGTSNEIYTEIVLKILHTGLNELLQTFRRYDFDIISYHDEDLHQETLKDNSEYLSKYLTV